MEGGRCGGASIGRRYGHTDAPTHSLPCPIRGNSRFSQARPSPARSKGTLHSDPARCPVTAFRALMPQSMHRRTDGPAGAAGAPRSGALPACACHVRRRAPLREKIARIRTGTQSRAEVRRTHELLTAPEIQDPVSEENSMKGFKCSFCGHARAVSKHTQYIYPYDETSTRPANYHEDTEGIRCSGLTRQAPPPIPTLLSLRCRKAISHEFPPYCGTSQRAL